MADKCTECEIGVHGFDVCGLHRAIVEMHGAEDDDGVFCIRCGHAPECHRTSKGD